MAVALDDGRTARPFELLFLALLAHLVTGRAGAGAGDGAARPLPHDPLSDLVRLLFLWILGAANGELRLESAGSPHRQHRLIAHLALEPQDRMQRRLLDGGRAVGGSLGGRGPLLLR